MYEYQYKIEIYTVSCHVYPKKIAVYHTHTLHTIPMAKYEANLYVIKTSEEERTCNVFKNCNMHT